jgi:hypothetical protein
MSGAPCNWKGRGPVSIGIDETPLTARRTPSDSGKWGDTRAIWRSQSKNESACTASFNGGYDQLSSRFTRF